MNDDDGRDGTEIMELADAQVETSSEINTQIATARRFPRSVVKSRQRATELACLDEETAASCFYSLPRAGKNITGPSARLAEIVASSWGNVRYGARVVGDDGKEVIAQGMCHDLESNVAVSIEVRRRITNRKGETYDADMIAVTGNAANSIAMRNAILKVIPGALWKPVYEAARKVAIGDAVTLKQRRDGAVAYFGKMGVTPDRVAKAVGKEKVEEIGLDELEVLTGLKTAIRDGDTTVDAAFPEPKGPAPEPKRVKKDEKKDPAPSAGEAGQPAGAEAKPSGTDGGGTPTAPQQQTSAPAGEEAPAGPAIGPKTSTAISDQMLEKVILRSAAFDRQIGERGAAMRMLNEDYGVASVSRLTEERAQEFSLKLGRGMDLPESEL